MSLSTLPIHPTTGLRAIGMSKRGPIWPVFGGSVDDGKPSNQGGEGGSDEGGNGGGGSDSGDEELGKGGLKALKAERAANAELKNKVKDLEAQLNAKPAGGASSDSGKPTKPKADGDSVEERLAALQQQIEEERAARERAEASAKTEKVADLRQRLAKGKLPEPLAALLTGETEDEINQQIDELAPHVKAGMLPNPQQGNPSRGKGGTLATGRERYAEAHKK